jgi:hypothetical protein
MSRSGLIDYFYLEAGFTDGGRSTRDLLRSGGTQRQTLKIENTGHFPADVRAFGEIPHGSTGVAFAGGARWGPPEIRDLKVGETADRDTALDLSAARAGTESWRVGLTDYADRTTGRRAAAIDPPLGFDVIVR